jgi:hypothetical protein
MAIQLFGITQQKFTTRSIYEFIKNEYKEWFPHLPKYQNYNRRICNLSEAFKVLAEQLHKKHDYSELFNITCLLDSMPIIVASSKRSSDAKVASDICDKGYCSSKGMFYYGIKLHYLGIAEHRSLPKDMFMSWITSASTNDITTAKDQLQYVRNIDIIADKAYCSATWHTDMKLFNNVSIFTPVKLKKGQKLLDMRDKYFNKAVSSIRQPIESFFGWLIDKTRIQTASKVRSASGLLSFVFARIAASLFF